MIQFNGQTYHLCLIDTNILSEMLKGKSNVFEAFCIWAFSGPRKSIPCFSLFSILELRKCPVLYKKFLDLFSIFPCIFLKGHEELISDEILAYPDPSSISPVSQRFAGLFQSSDCQIDKVLNALFTSPDIQAKEQMWLSSRQEIVDGITSLVKNFKQEGEKYSPKEIRMFLEMAGFAQVVYRNKSFVEAVLNRREAVRIDAFPSIKMMVYTVFFKYYPDRRTPLSSDAFDIIISSLTPYVDTIITERHQVEVIKKIKNRDAFIKNLDALSLRDLLNPKLNN